MKQRLFLFLVLTCAPFVLWSSQISWASPPIVISTNGVNGSDPQIEVDSSGNATAVWVENGVIMWSALPVNGSWSAPAALSGAGSSLPKLGIDGSGNVTALWLQGGVATAKTRPAGGAWSSASSLSSILATVSEPQLAVDSAGNAVAVWQNNGLIESASKLVAGIWGLATTISSGPADSVPQVAIGADGTVVAAWHIFISASSSHSIGYNNKTINLIWGAPRTVFSATAAFIHHYPQIVVDSSGNATLAWFRYLQSGTSYTNVTLISSTLLKGATTWALPTLFSDPYMRNPANTFLRMGVDSSGNVIVLWNPSIDGSQFKIQALVKPAGGNWTAFATVLGRDQYALSTDIAVDPNGDTVAVYMTFNGTFASIGFAETNLAGAPVNAWSFSANFSDGFNNGFPRVAKGRTGDAIKAVAVWINNDGVNNRIVAATGSKTLLAAPSNMAVVQNSASSGIFTDYYNTITWNASPDPEAAGYILYRNGIVIARLNRKDSQFVDHNQGQNEAVTYGVAAHDERFLQSQTVTVSLP